MGSYISGLGGPVRDSKWKPVASVSDDTLTYENEVLSVIRWCIMIQCCLLHQELMSFMSHL